MKIASSCVFCAAVVLLSSSQQLDAQTDKSVCEAIAPSMMQASDSFSSLMNSMRAIDFLAVTPNLGAEEAEQFRTLAARRDALMPVADEFLAALDEAALMMRACSR